MLLGIDCFLKDQNWAKKLSKKRIGLLCNAASVTSDLRPSIDSLLDAGFRVTALFGPQHGYLTTRQDNMVETPNQEHPQHHIPVYSLYSSVRRPTVEMLQEIDVLCVDLQDLGTRIYTFLTTLLYCLEECSKASKHVIILDRPNPAGRFIEGLILEEPQWNSFVGAAPVIIRHGLTLAEIAKWYINVRQLSVLLDVVPMQGYDPAAANGYGWPEHLAWLNPSPNAATLNMARCYPGTVLIEGTTLSEGRGTTRPLEGMGAPDLDILKILNKMHALNASWLEGVRIRTCYFEPMFHKYAGKVCAGIQFHTDHPAYQPEVFKPYRSVILFLKAIRLLHPHYPLWRQFEYEYEKDRLAFDLINGTSWIREWIDDSHSSVRDLEKKLLQDECLWDQMRQEYLLY